MTPTLTGRLQTRLALAVLPGLPVAAFAAATLDRLTPTQALIGLLVITLLGFGWDVLHQGLQDRRWDRDWPRIFTLLSWAPEAFGSWLALNALDAAAPLGSHLAFFTLLWGSGLVVRATLLPVLLPRWRHEGQRLLGARPARRAAVEAATTTETPAAEPATAPAPHRAPGRSGLAALGLTPSTGRMATLALLLGVLGALVLIAPLLENKEGSRVSADARATANDANPSMTSRLTPHVHKNGDVHVHGEDGEKGASTPATGGDRQDEWNTTERILPAYVEFASADIATSLRMTLMKEDGVLVTPSPEHAAWYGQGAAPGQRGPAVVIGSTDNVFKGLDNAKRGQGLRVVRADGSQVHFIVDRVATVDARSFPTQKVYGASAEPLLRLVGYDESSGRNTIVFAHAVSMVKSPVEG